MENVVLSSKDIPTGSRGNELDSSSPADASVIITFQKFHSKSETLDSRDQSSSSRRIADSDMPKKVEPMSECGINKSQGFGRATSLRKGSGGKEENVNCICGDGQEMAPLWDEIVHIHSATITGIYRKVIFVLCCLYASLFFVIGV